ncbi:MAG: PAS domain-containing protein, partial [Cytophagaceae bacterium]
MTKGFSGLLGKKSSQKFKVLYIIALSAVAVMTILGQILIQRAIYHQLSDSHVVNLAGSQRYMSQQIVKFSLLITEDVSHPDASSKVDELASFLKKWQKGHNGLQFGDKSLQLPGNNSPEVMQMFRDINPYFENILVAAGKIADEGYKEHPDKEKMEAQLAVILDNEYKFFKGMDNIVYMFDKEAKGKLLTLKRLELILFVLIIITLVLEGLFIFRPTVNEINSTINKLVESESKAKGLADKLKVTNFSLQKSNKDLRDINFAVERANILARTDRFGVITFVNQKFCDILKYSPGELIGQRFSMISSHYHSKAFYDEMWETISSGQVWNHEVQNMAKDGSHVWLDATIVSIMDSSGSPEGYIAIYTDVTSRFRQSINEQKIKSASILDGQERERKNIARELHDGLGQMLTALKFNFDGIKGSKSKKEQDALVELRKQIKETIQETRRISFNLMPSVLNDFGLIPTLRHLTDQVSKHSNVRVCLDCEWDNQRLAKPIEVNLYRIVQEALNNAVKYAEADEVSIFIDKLNGHLRLSVEDNGKGFDHSSINKRKIVFSGNGITNMQERTEILKGDFRIHSAPGEGT